MPERIVNDRDITRDLLSEIAALRLALDTLAQIAEMGGVQGDWAMGGLRRVREILAPERSLTAVPDVEPDLFERALGDGRR